MSELTRCNYCGLRDMRREYGDRLTTEVIPSDSDVFAGWTLVLVDGHARAWMQTVTEECAC